MRAADGGDGEKRIFRKWPPMAAVGLERRARVLPPPRMRAQKAEEVIICFGLPIILFNVNVGCARWLAGGRHANDSTDSYVDNILRGILVYLMFLYVSTQSLAGCRAAAAPKTKTKTEQRAKRGGGRR